MSFEEVLNNGIWLGFWYFFTKNLLIPMVDKFLFFRVFTKLTSRKKAHEEKKEGQIKK